jgi:hypothetical protein
MPKYCPTCLGEFKDTVKTCPKDQAVLSDKKLAVSDRLIDVYVASDEMEAERIMALLEEEGILATESSSGISQLPTIGDSRFIIAVQRGSIKQSKSVIEQARHDGVVSLKGVFI